MPDSSIGFIIDNYSPYNNNKNVVKTFHLYGQPYCIRQIEQFEWGQPQFPEKDIDDEFLYYHVYTTLDEALEYIHEQKIMEGTRF